METEEFNRYRADAQSRFKLTSDELLAELERRIAADRETRVQGAEDKTLNEGKKILLAITFSADAGDKSASGFARGEEADPRALSGIGARDAARMSCVFCVNGRNIEADPLPWWPQRDEGDRVIAWREMNPACRSARRGLSAQRLPTPRRAGSSGS